MRCRLSVCIATLIVAILALHATPARARNRSRRTRRMAWCTTPFKRSSDLAHLTGGSAEVYRVRKASKDCCAAVFHFAYFSEFFGKCYSQGGAYSDRGIDWLNFKRCCEERPDAGMAASDEFYFDDMDMKEEAHGLEPVQGARWTKMVGWW